MTSEQIRDRAGYVWATLTWRDGALVELAVPGAFVTGAVIEDPLFGRAHAIDHPTTIDPRGMTDHAGLPRRRATTMSAIDWARPTEIPAIARPGALLAGAGSAIMNVLAILAQRAGVPALRYAGPFPTSALWSTLLRSFATTGTEDAFTADFIERAARVARDPIAIDFVPAPHERLGFAGGHVELRGGSVECAVIHGVTYRRGGSVARLVGDRAEVWFGDTRWAHVATFAADGELVDGLHAIPPATSSAADTVFPPALVAALGELIAGAVPAPLAGAARAAITTRTIRWADLGARAAVRAGDELHVHVALWERVAPHGMARLALALVEALAPVVAQLAVAPY